MFSIISKPTYDSIAERISYMKSICGDIPIYLVGNKAELTDKQEVHVVNFDFKAVYYGCSVKVDTNEWEDPLIDIIKGFPSMNI